MADFVAVLRKTVDALGDNTPEMREKVFEKARSTIDAKLKAIQPPPPAAVVERQRKALEDAIAVIKTDYARKQAPEKDETLEDVFASLKTMGDVKPPSPPARPDQPAAKTFAPAPAAAPKPYERKPYEPFAAKPVEVRRTEALPEVLSTANDPAAPDPHAAGEDGDDVVEPAVERERRRRRMPVGLIAAVVALFVFAAAGYGVWTNRDDFAALVGLGQPPSVEEEDAAATAEDLAAVEAEEPASQPEPEAEPETEAEEVIAALPPAEPEPPAAAPAAEEPGKFTQRLMPDGSEVDEGPAGGPRSVGEGTSVAAATTPSAEETATDASPETEAAPDGTAAEPPAEISPAAARTPPSAVAVGQRAIFYEERTTSASGSAEVGNIVWSVVQESPGGDLPPEPAIRAEATIPGRDIQLRMTIRRNGDQTLPASHIIEMIFLTPDGFEGGTIANVTRVSFKETEQATGNALIGIPAKIADGFFLIALGDAPAEVETNTTLLRRQSWIDIPITYESGRRALLTMEKGIPGDKVFQDTLSAWDEASSG